MHHLALAQDGIKYSKVLKVVGCDDKQAAWSACVGGAQPTRSTIPDAYRKQVENAKS